MFEPVCMPGAGGLCTELSLGESCDPQCEDLYQCNGVCEAGLLCDPMTATCSNSVTLEPVELCNGPD